MTPKKISEDLSVEGQPALSDFADAARLGFRTVISARPDGEQPGQTGAVEIEQAARAAGLEFAHIPVVPGKIEGSDVAAFTAAFESLPKPVLGFCRTGMRAATLWALSQAGKQDADALIEAAKNAGFDLSPLRGKLR